MAQRKGDIPLPPVDDSLAFFDTEFANNPRSHHRGGDKNPGLLFQLSCARPVGGGKYETKSWLIELPEHAFVSSEAKQTVGLTDANVRWLKGQKGGDGRRFNNEKPVPFADVADEISGFMTGYTWAHHGSPDPGVLNAAYTDAGLQPPDLEFVNTAPAAQAVAKADRSVLPKGSLDAVAEAAAEGPGGAELRKWMKRRETEGHDAATDTAIYRLAYGHLKTVHDAYLEAQGLGGEEEAQQRGRGATRLAAAGGDRARAR